MLYSVLFERIEDPDFPLGYYYAHIPALGLTTHGQGVEGARDAAKELITLWIAEKKAHGESIKATSDLLYSAIEIENAVQSV